MSNRDFNLTEHEKDIVKLMKPEKWYRIRRLNKKVQFTNRMKTSMKKRGIIKVRKEILDTQSKYSVYTSYEEIRLTEIYCKFREQS